VCFNLSDAKELVGELEFVWNQIRHNSPTSSSNSSPKQIRRFEQPSSGTDGPMKVLSPMSEQDEAEMRSQRQLELEDEQEEEDAQNTGRISSRWQRKVERAITNLSAEIAALREQITTGREWRTRKDRSFPAWLGWAVWLVMKHLIADLFILSLVLVWMRKRKDRRLEDLVRGVVRLAREYIRKILPSR
jgi:hypothetical protein